MVQVGYWLEPSTSRVKPMGKWLISLQNTMRGIVDIGCIAVESLLAELVVVLLLVLLESEPPPVFDGPAPLVPWLDPVVPVVASLATMIGLVSIIASTRLAVPPSSK